MDLFAFFRRIKLRTGLENKSKGEFIRNNARDQHLIEHEQGIFVLVSVYAGSNCGVPSESIGSFDGVEDRESVTERVRVGLVFGAG